MQQQLDWMDAQKLREKVRGLLAAPVFSARGTRVWRMNVGGFLACSVDREHIGIGSVSTWYRFWNRKGMTTCVPHLHEVPRAVAWAYMRQTAQTRRVWAYRDENAPSPSTLQGGRVTYWGPKK